MRNVSVYRVSGIGLYLSLYASVFLSKNLAASPTTTNATTEFSHFVAVFPQGVGQTLPALSVCCCNQIFLMRFPFSYRFVVFPLLRLFFRNKLVFTIAHLKLILLFISRDLFLLFTLGLSPKSKRPTEEDLSTKGMCLCSSDLIAV